MATVEPTPVLRTAVHFVRVLWESLGWRLAGSMAIAVALALAEGAGVTLLVPLLASIDLAVDDGPASRLASMVDRAFAAAGLEPSLPVVLLVFLGITSIHAALYRAHLLVNPSLEQRFSTALRIQLYSRIVGASWAFLLRQRVPDLVHTTTSLVDRSSSAAYQLLTLLAGLAVTAVYAALALRMSPALTALVAIAGLVMLWTLRGRTQRSADSGDRYAASDVRLFRMASETLTGLKVTKSLGAESRQVAAFSHLAAERADGYLSLLRSFAQAKLRLDLTNATIACALLFVAVEWLGLRGAGLLVLVFAFARVMPRAVALQESLQMFVTGLSAFAAVTRVIDECAAAQEEVDRAPAGPMAMTRDLRLERVSFGYEADAPILRGATLAIPHGAITAIVGSSGAGKSTAADLLLGLLEPQGGAVLIDGVPLQAADRQRWRRSVGYVPQEGFLLHDTVRANLLWARPDASEPQMWDALEQAAAATFVRGRGHGLDLVVGDRGIQLSGGERQRLALARALLLQPQLLVLDEATSALDAMNEQLILRAVRALRHRVTTVIITHRLHAIQAADLIHVIEDGAVVQSGTWDALAAEDGAFARLLSAHGDSGDHRPAADPAATSGRATAIHGQ